MTFEVILGNNKGDMDEINEAEPSNYLPCYFSQSDFSSKAQNYTPQGICV